MRPVNEHLSLAMLEKMTYALFQKPGKGFNPKMIIVSNCLFGKKKNPLLNVFSNTL